MVEQAASQPAHKASAARRKKPVLRRLLETIELTPVPA
jgi:hypothetical protein